MARKGKLLKKPSAGGPQNASAKDAASKDDRASSLKKGPGQGDAAKKQISGDLGGFIFMCNGSTKPDCFKYRVFGLNEGKRNLVEQVRKGMRLFLFDVDLRLLYGIYVAASQGTYKLERDAFGGGFPWQVRFSIQKDCLPLPEDIFQAAIKENYIDKRKFKVELTTEQVHRLVKLFRPLPNSIGRSPPRPRMAAPDQFEGVAKPRSYRHQEIDRYAQDRLGSRRLSPRAKYETSFLTSDAGRLPPLTKYETPYASSDAGRLPPLTKYETYASSDAGRLPPLTKYETTYSDAGRLPPLTKYETTYAPSDTGRFPPLTKYETTYAPSDRYSEKQVTGFFQSLNKYAQLYPREESRIPDGRASDDLYLGRELRSQQEAGSLVPSHSLASLSAYNADPLHPLSDLRQPRARDELSVYSQGRARDELSVYSQGSTVGADIDPLYRQRLRVPDVRPDVLDRRVAGLDPLVESSLVYSGGLSSDLLRGRASDTYASSTGYGGLLRNENGTDPLSGGVTGASALAYRGDLLPQSRYYGSSGY